MVPSLAAAGVATLGQVIGDRAGAGASVRTRQLAHARQRTVALGAVPPAALGLLLTCVYFQALLRAAARPGCDLDRLCSVWVDSQWAWWPAWVALAGVLLG